MYPPATVIIVSGPSCTGKTTLAHRLAAGLTVPVYSRDRIKEALFDTVGWSDRRRSQQLGAAAAAVLLGQHPTGCVFADYLRHPPAQHLAIRYPNRGVPARDPCPPPMSVELGVPSSRPGAIFGDKTRQEIERFLVVHTGLIALLPEYSEQLLFGADRLAHHSHDGRKNGSPLAWMGYPAAPLGADRNRGNVNRPRALRTEERRGSDLTVVGRYQYRGRHLVPVPTDRHAASGCGSPVSADSAVATSWTVALT